MRRHVIVEPSTMTRTTKAILFLPILLLIASSCSSPSKRNLVEFSLKDGSKIQCVEPPPDVVAKGLKVNADIAAEHIGNLLRGTGGVDVDIERIRQEVTPDISAFEVIEYRICVQYGNAVLSKDEYRTFTERILPAIRNRAPDTDRLSELTIEAVNDPISRIPLENQPRPPRAAYFSRIRVNNVGRQPIRNVKLVVLKADEMQGRFQLPTASIENLFEFPDSSLPNLSVDLNPGDDSEFEAVVECSGIKGKRCPKGRLAILYVDNGKITTISPTKEGIESLNEVTVRATGEGAAAATKTFRVSKTEDGLIVLKERPE